MRSEILIYFNYAQVVKPAYTPALGAGAARHVGSSPTLGKFKIPNFSGF